MAFLMGITERSSSMKAFKVLLVLGLVLVTSGVASAITFNQEYTGPIKMKFSNFESARLYNGPEGTYTADSGPGELTLTDLKNTAWSSGASYGSIAPPGGMQGEDAWGLFELMTIAGKNPVTGAYDVVLWEKGGPKDTVPDVVGIFYGVEDRQVTLRKVDGLLEQEVWSAGDIKLDLYEVPNGSADLKDPSARTALDQFPGWTNGTAVLKGAALADEIKTPPAPSGMKFWSRTILNPDDGTIVERESALGTAKLFVEWYGGSEYTKFKQAGPDAGFLTTIYGNETSFEWTANSDDPAFGFFTGKGGGTDPGVIPEPLTLLGLLLATGSAGTYLRRRLF